MSALSRAFCDLATQTSQIPEAGTSFSISYPSDGEFLEGSVFRHTGDDLFRTPPILLRYPPSVSQQQLSSSSTRERERAAPGSWWWTPVRSSAS